MTSIPLIPVESSALQTYEVLDVNGSDVIVIVPVDKDIGPPVIEICMGWFETEHTVPVPQLRFLICVRFVPPPSCNPCEIDAPLFPNEIRLVVKPLNTVAGVPVMVFPVKIAVALASVVFRIKEVLPETRNVLFVTFAEECTGPVPACIWIIFLTAASA